MSREQLMSKEIFDQIKPLFSQLSRTITVEENEIFLFVDSENLISAAQLLNQKFEPRLISSVVTDDRKEKNCFSLRYLFSLDCSSLFIILETIIDPENCQYDSITPYVPGAHLFERENFEFFGLIPKNHPDLKRALLHDDWPENMFPLRKDFDWNSKVERKIDCPYRFLQVEGEGVFEVPVGPVHAGIIEPGHFRFSVAGEPVINLEIRLGYVHKGIEKLAEGKSCMEVLKIAERVSGDASFAHSLAFCHAVEKSFQVVVPLRAKALRTVFAELERMYNHLGDIAGIATDVGFAFGSMQMLRLREIMLQKNHELSGHRLLRGINIPGGVLIDLNPKKAEELSEFLIHFIVEFESIEKIILESDSLMDRVEGTGKVSFQLAKDFCAVGPSARASGIDIDLRKDHPYGNYGSLQFKTPVLQEGDVSSRMQVKIAELKQSVSLIRQSLQQFQEGILANPIPDHPQIKETFGWVESSRGEIVHWIRICSDGKIGRLKIKSPSFVNWPLISWAVRGNIIPDFPLINKSFNLSYSGNDR